MESKAYTYEHKADCKILAMHKMLDLEGKVSIERLAMSLAYPTLKVWSDKKTLKSINVPVILGGRVFVHNEVKYIGLKQIVKSFKTYKEQRQYIEELIKEDKKVAIAVDRYHVKYIEPPMRMGHHILVIEKMDDEKVLAYDGFTGKYHEFTHENLEEAGKFNKKTPLSINYHTFHFEGTPEIVIRKESIQKNIVDIEKNINYLRRLIQKLQDQLDQNDPEVAKKAQTMLIKFAANYIIGPDFEGIFYRNLIYRFLLEEKHYYLALKAKIQTFRYMLIFKKMITEKIDLKTLMEKMEETVRKDIGILAKLEEKYE